MISVSLDLHRSQEDDFAQDHYILRFSQVSLSLIDSTISEGKNIFFSGDRTDIECKIAVLTHSLALTAEKVMLDCFVLTALMAWPISIKVER